MDDNQENNFSMKLGLESVLSKYQADWIGIPRFKDAVTDFRSYLSQIDNQKKVQEKHTKGAADVKSANRMVMCEDAIVVAKIVKAYAKYNNDPVLKDLVDYSYTELFNVRDTDSKTKCNDIYDAALPIEADLVTNYGLSTMALPNLNSGISAYANVIMTPIVAKGVRKTAGKNLKQLIKVSDEILKDSIDNMMMPFKKAKPDFYNEYFSARIIINYGKAQVSVEKKLQPGKHVVLFANKFLPGDTFTIRNHSVLAKIKVFLSDGIDVPTTAGIEIAPKMEQQLAIPEGFKMPFAHNLIVLNESTMDDAQVTVIFAHGKSHSKAGNETATKLK